jgi:phosphosulfolactate synthase
VSASEPDGAATPDATPAGGQSSNGSMAGFLAVPERSCKPRERGVTHVIDRGLSIAQVDGLMETVGEYVDIVKLGWGTALVTANLKPKLERYAAHGVPVVLGGTLTEIAIKQGRVEGLVAWLRELGLRHVEISDGTIALDGEVKAHLIGTLAAAGFTVLSEVGSKDVEHIMAPYVWVEQIERDLQAGAWKVIAEARESGTAGIYRADGEVRTGLIDEIVHAVEAERLIFEAPRREQQVWLLKQLGNECNLGNIAPDDVLSLETLRLGLRSDTVESFAAGGEAPS